MHTKTRAIVLRAIKYGDSKLIVDMLTEEHGRVSFAVNVSARGKSKGKKMFFQPLSLLEIELDYRMQTELQKLHSVSFSNPFLSLQTDAIKLSEALFVAEIIYYSTREEQQNLPLFHFIEQSLRWLDEAKNGYSNFHLVFLLGLTRHIGFEPNTEEAGLNSFFDLRNGYFCTAPPLHQDFVMPQEARLLSTLMRLSYATMHVFRMSQAERNRCLDLFMRYYRLHVPGFPELKSLEVLHELWAKGSV